MTNTAGLATKEKPTDYSYEMTMFSTVPWEKEHAVEKTILLIRTIMCIANLEQTEKVLRILESNEAKTFPFTQPLKSITEMFLDHITPFADTISTNENELRIWSSISSCAFRENTKKFREDPLRTKLVKMIEGAYKGSNVLIIPNVTQEFLRSGFHKEIAEILDARLQSKNQNLDDLWSAATILKDYYGSATDQPIKNFWEHLLSNLTDKIKSAVEEADKNRDFETYKKLSGYLNFQELQTPLSKQTKDFITNSAKGFLGKCFVSSDMPWKKTSELANLYSHHTLEYYKRGIKEAKNFGELWTESSSGNSTTPFWEKLNLLLLLRKEELIREWISSETDLKKLDKIRREIPAGLPHLHGEVLVKARELFNEEK